MHVTLLHACLYVCMLFGCLCLVFASLFGLLVFGVGLWVFALSLACCYRLICLDFSIVVFRLDGLFLTALFAWLFGY